MSEQFNIDFYTTEANSAWSNGICDSNHAVIDLSVQKMIEDDCNMDLEDALASSKFFFPIAKTHCSIIMDILHIN